MTETESQKIARRLIRSRVSADGKGASPAHAAAAACDNIYRELSRWVGPDGCHALFARALAQAKGDNSALGQIGLRARAEPYIEGVPDAIAASGDAPTAAALETMLIHLIELLGRLIGEDMATKLIDRTTTMGAEDSMSAPTPSRTGG